MTKNYMNSSLNMEGVLCGVKTNLVAGYVEDGLLFSAEIEVTRESLQQLLGLFGSMTQENTEPYVAMLGDFQINAKFAYKNRRTMLVVQSDLLNFLAYDGLQGKIVVFSISPQELMNGQNGSLAQVVKGVTTVFGIHNFCFIYRNTNITNSDLYKAYHFLPSIPPIIEGDILLSTSFRFEELAKSTFANAMQSIFGISGMDIFLGIGKEQVSCALIIPDIENALLSCQNIVIYTKFATTGVTFQMSGAIGLSCFPGLKFYVNAGFNMTSVSISASSMPTSVFQIPNTLLSISNCALQIAFDSGGINLAAMSQINIRNLMWYGALNISYNGTVPMLDMINIAMSEVSISSLVSNLAGISSKEAEGLDIFAITAFDIGSSNEKKTINFKSLTDEEIITAVNIALQGIKPEFLLTKETASITRLPGDNACDILNTRTMFHYWLDSNGELSFPPQAYYASKHITMGAYNFEQGVFFSGQMELLGQHLKIMFSAVKDKGLLGYAELEPIRNSVIVISGSTSAENNTNPVLGNTTNSTLELLTQDFYSDEEKDRPVILFVDVTRNACCFYLDGHIEICKIFSFDAMLYFSNKKIHISVETNYFNMIKASLYLDVDYQKLMRMAFEFEVALDCTGLQENLKRVSTMLDEAVSKYNKKIQEAQKKVNDAKQKVASLQSEINRYNQMIEESKRKIKKAKWYQIGLVIKEGAKIVSYEISLAGIYLAMKVAEKALDLVNAVLSLVNKLGSGFLNAINAVIQGVLNVFYISKALLRIIVNGSHMLVHTNLELTVIGQQISVNETVDLNKLIGNPVSLLEDLTINQIKALIDKISNGVRPQYEAIETKPYPYMIFSEEPAELAEIVAYGSKRINQAKGMVEELQNLYIDEIQELEPELADMDTEFKEAAQMASYSLQKASENIHLKGMDQLFMEITEARNHGMLTEEESNLADACASDYMNSIRPASTTIEESCMRINECVNGIDTGCKAEHLRSIRRDTGSSNGTEILEDRDYEKFYGNLQATVEKYFPKGSGHGYFNFTDEDVFYEALNNARREAGCAYVTTQQGDTEAEQKRGSLFEKGIFDNGVTEGYIQRLRFD